jgi:SNF2 family DNA or RNA helicase
MVVLDEAQSIKNPASKMTHAVCRLDTRHRLCLSGTPIENNLGELWSQFAFLMPGLLGTRRSFNRRFRAPIENDADPIRRGQLATRIRPFILRRTKSAVASELPSKHTILRRVTLAPDQRDLYETIRATMHAKVTAGIAARGVTQSHVLVLQALLKLRQVCCDPRLTGLGTDAASSKLDDLLEMVAEMVAEGRRILLFSQFTSMLDLMKPALVAAGVRFVELRGDTLDRAEPVRRFEAGEVAVFLISLKAGGRGLNLTSADTVIHYDPWWNPAVEDQASDRAHRIGQTKSVFIYKLIAADTVEERIVELQERKAALAHLALNEDATAPAAMDADDIDYLFGVAPDRLAA